MYKYFAIFFPHELLNYTNFFTQSVILSILGRGSSARNRTGLVSTWIRYGCGDGTFGLLKQVILWEFPLFPARARAL